MKKISKVLIALVLIVGLALGAYFAFSSKDSSRLVRQNVYDLSYNIKDKEDNIVEDINSTVTEMRNLIIAHTMQLDNVYTNLQMYSDLFAYYSTVGNEVLALGGFVKNANIDAYINAACASYNKIVDVYKKSYEYLKDTYYKIDNKNLYVETVKAYIQNFYEIFKDLIPEFNTFYYNTSLAYAYGVEDTMQHNNFYKLKVAYFAECINQYYINTDNKVLLNVHVLLLQSDINDDFTTKYFDNKDIYDELAVKVKDINISELAVKVATAKDSEFLDSIPTEAERKIAQNYIDYVARG